MQTRDVCAQKMPKNANIILYVLVFLFTYYLKYPLWNCGGPVTQRGPLWQLECELLPIVQGPSKKMGPNRLKNVLMVGKYATPILNNLPQ